MYAIVVSKSFGGNSSAFIGLKTWRITGRCFAQRAVKRSKRFDLAIRMTSLLEYISANHSAKRDNIYKRETEKARERERERERELRKMSPKAPGKINIFIHGGRGRKWVAEIGQTVLSRVRKAVRHAFTLP